MKIFIFFFLVFNLEVKAKENIPAFFECKKPEECLESLFKEKKVWGRLIKNYKTAVDLWKTSPIVKFQVIGKEGEQKVEKKDDKFIPLIILPKIHDSYELIISLNHELVHTINSYKALAFINDDKKINNCLTKYRLELLKDESAAFREEIYFWEQSPDWFKQYFSKQSFESKMLEGKFTYGEYYKVLKEKMDADNSFIEKRYIAIGQYPTCAKDLLNK